MTTTDFMGYIEQIQQWSAEYLNVQNTKVQMSKYK